MLSFIQKCKECGLMQTASYEHESPCFGGCKTSPNIKKMRSRSKIEERIHSLESKKSDKNLETIKALEWVLGRGK
jgi:hypothetical protein